LCIKALVFTKKRGSVLFLTAMDLPIIDNCTSYLSCFNEWIEIAEEETVREYKRMRLYPRERYVMDPPKMKQQASGEERLREFEWLLENGFRWKRHKFQKEFHAKAVMVLSQQIVGNEDWDKVGPVLVKERKWDMSRNSKILLGKAPRRFGKSVSSGMLAAAYVIVVPVSTQAIFSTSQRIAFYMGELIYKAICDAGYEWRIKKFGEERMEVWGPLGADDPHDVRKVFYYPANAKVTLTRMIFGS
jgi:hypothetical protein